MSSSRCVCSLRPPGGGTGLAFFDRRPGLSAFWALGATALLSLALGPQAIALNAAFALITAGLIAFYRRQLGCVTGDMLGAMIEATEAGLFLVAAVGGQHDQRARRQHLRARAPSGLRARGHPRPQQQRQPARPAARAARAPGRTPGRDRGPARGRQPRHRRALRRAPRPAGRAHGGRQRHDPVHLLHPVDAADPAGADRGADLLGLRRQLPPAGHRPRLPALVRDGRLPRRPAAALRRRGRGRHGLRLQPQQPHRRAHPGRGAAAGVRRPPGRALRRRRVLPAVRGRRGPAEPGRLRAGERARPAFDLQDLPHPGPAHRLSRRRPGRGRTVQERALALERQRHRPGGGALHLRIRRRHRPVYGRNPGPPRPRAPGPAGAPGRDPRHAPLPLDGLLRAGPAARGADGGAPPGRAWQRSASSSATAAISSASRSGSSASAPVRARRTNGRPRRSRPGRPRNAAEGRTP
ncbi:MAG: adenosylcobinamide-GDP ribazoletransferase [Desulfobacterales bacterium]|nr:adenosylcobinamide-GDP ribazoletransferase [Desulfobacterales bacterium]